MAEDDRDQDCPPARKEDTHQHEWELFNLLEHVPVGIFVATAAGKPYYANQLARRLLQIGQAPEHVDRFSEAFGAFETGSDWPYPGERLPVVRALAGETCEITDLELRRRDGTTTQLHVSSAPLHLRGELAFSVTALQDIGELRRIATTDALTALPNRTAAVEAYARERLIAERNRAPLAVVLVDFDRFKSINDQHGHRAGDTVLRDGSAAIVAALRRVDIVARWGGEELLALLPATDAIGAAHAIEQALAAVRALDFGGTPAQVTFSAGVVVAAPDETLDDVIARADVLLYAAKRAGRNRVHHT